MGGNGGESHFLSVREEIGAGALDAAEGARVGHLSCDGLVDQGVESFDELSVSVGFGDPASLFGVAGECVGINALRSQDRQ